MFYQVMHVLIKILQMCTDLFYVPLHVFYVVVDMFYVSSHMLYEFLYFCHVYTSPRPHSVVRCISTIP